MTKNLVENEDAKKNESRLSGRFWSLCLIVFTVAGITLAILQLFLIRPILENAYMYWLMGFFMSFVFIIHPATNKFKGKRPPFYDIFFFVLTLSISSFYALSAWDIIHSGWAFISPLWVSITAAVYCLLILEAVRRAGGTTLFLFTGVFAAYPLFCHIMPGFLEGNSMGFWQVVRYHVLSTESVLGIPMQVVANIIMGFIVFGVVLVATGGGKFFLDFAFALLGTQSGGPAKVSVISSGLFGSLSGSVISNIITTGSVTIPTMKKIGYPSHYAAAVEACASAGGCIMPPVMGAVAFVIASFLGVPYVQVAIAAAFPAFLYYLGLFMQVDFFARKSRLQGMEKADVPNLWVVLKDGIPYIFSILLLVYMLYLRKEVQAPFYTSLLLIVLAMARKKTRLHLKEFKELCIDTGKMLSGLVAVLAACGFIIGAFSLTGVGSSLSREVVQMAGGNVVLMLIFGAIASFILGMGMTVTACYIFLAIILVPALLKVYDFNVMSVHLFVLYWGIVSFITPPVALGSYTAAGIAGARPFQTGMTSVRLGVVKYLVPFFFVFCPELIFQGDLAHIVYYCSSATIGIVILAAGLEGYFYGLGKLSYWSRPVFILGGFLIAAPHNKGSLIGVIILCSVIAYLSSKKWKQVHAVSYREP